MAAAGLLADFEALLQASRQQDEPQRLLFVFARKQLDQHATAEQRERFERGEGGHLQPCLCVDKMPDEITSFATLRAESERTGLHWDIVFVGCLPGHRGKSPDSDETDQALRFMVNAINEGRIGEFAAFNRAGDALRLVSAA